jgi:hypothetical protein
MTAPATRKVAGLHAGYLVATGVWPLLHRKSFEALTGRKKDFWLVRTVGGLAGACGLTLATAVIRYAGHPKCKSWPGRKRSFFVLADLHAATSQSRIYLADIGCSGGLHDWLAPAVDPDRLS